MTEKVPMTPEGHETLRDELHRLREVEMPQVVKEIGTAREHGDLSENAEYHAAKERQGMIHARIKYIEDVLSRAEVIDPAKLGGDKVKFGARVSLLNLDTDEEMAYQIVGPEESDLKRNRISVTSPLARGLIGREVGDAVTIKLPTGTRNYEIQEISWG
jgi:transcription elongation factor GreA